MVQIAINPNSKIEIEKDTLLDDKTFNLVLNALNNHTVNEILDVFYFLRSNFDHSTALLNLAEIKSNNSSQLENIKIQRIGLMLQHNHNVKDLLSELKHNTEKRVEFLRGVFFISCNQIDDALFTFEKINYKPGIEKCAVLKNLRREMSLSEDPVVKCYFSSKNWANFNEDIKNKDFLYTIGKSKSFDHIDNIDVQIKQIEECIDNKAYTGLITKLLSFIDNGFSSPQIFYDIGKIYHLTDDYEKAIQWYEKSLSLEKVYLPAKFNLARIKNRTIEDKCNYSAVSDFNSIISMKMLNFDVDLNNCTDRIRKICWTIIQARKLNKLAVSEFECLENDVDSVSIENNKALLLTDEKSVKNNEKSIKILENLLKKADSNYLEFIKYNLGILRKDIKLLEECNVPEAQLYIDYFNNNSHTSDLRLKAYITDDINLIQDKNDPFFIIFSGNKLLEEYIKNNDDQILEKAEETFRLNISSPFCINGLALCAVFRNNISAALKLFNQIINDVSGVYKNIALCYLIQKDYQKSMEWLLKGPLDNLSKDDEKILLFLADKTEDLKAIDLLIDRGFESLKKIKALIYLKKGELKNAIDLKVNDQEVLIKINELKDKENERKRKIDELDEYRKKRLQQ